jgi:ribosomal protein S12 methylthiotransferase accessory factor
MTGMPRQPNAVCNDAIPAQVGAALHDPARLCPTLAGAAWLQGDRLAVRTAARDVEVRAPRALLAQVHALCDGTRTMEEVIAQAAPSHAADLRAFLPFLLEQGALVDANLLALHAAGYAHQGSPFGRVAPPAVTNQLCRRFLWNASGAPDALPAGTREVPRAPLADLFAERVSTYTFGDAAVDEGALLQFAWSIAGVVRTRHARVGYVAPSRTLASAGGMHLLRVHLVLRRPVGSYAPGVYRVGYPAERAVVLERLADEGGLLPRAFAKPWELETAAGAVFISADAEAAAMRYRNRAMQYLFMEAGAALHNAGLTAPQLGLAFATIGGYHEKVVASLCRLDGEAVLGSGIFGAAPGAGQVERSAQALDLEFTWVDGSSERYPLPFHLASARVRTEGDERPHTWGRDADPWLAYVKAAAEAVEREGFRAPRELRVATIAQLPDAVDPGTIVRYSQAQYARPGFPFAPFDPARAYCWTRGTELASGRGVHVLAELVFSRASIEALGHAAGPPCTQVTSSGCAAGRTREDAAHRALLEVVERDAFMRHWLCQRPGRLLARSALGAPVQARIAALEVVGCRVAVQQLASPWAHVALVSAQHEALHFTTMGTAAKESFDASLLGALEETEARVYAWLHGHEAHVARPADVATPEHHFELYGSRRHFHRADAVLFPDAQASGELPPAFAASDLEGLCQRMVAGGLRPVVVDITPPHASIDQGRSALVAVKALVPGLLPMSFGHGREPLGMVPRVPAAARFPHPFP